MGVPSEEGGPTNLAPTELGFGRKWVPPAPFDTVGPNPMPVGPARRPRSPEIRPRHVKRCRWHGPSPIRTNRPFLRAPCSMPNRTSKEVTPRYMPKMDHKLKTVRMADCTPVACRRAAGRGEAAKSTSGPAEPLLGESRTSALGSQEDNLQGKGQMIRRSIDRAQMYRYSDMLVISKLPEIFGIPTNRSCRGRAVLAGGEEALECHSETRRLRLQAWAAPRFADRQPFRARMSRQESRPSEFVKTSAFLTDPFWGPS